MKRININKFQIIAVASTITLATTFGITTTAYSSDSFPEREVRVVIPYSPGGATDIIFRLAGQEAEKQLSESIIPVNMAGAGATLGSRHVKDASPDGHTILGSHDTIATSYLSGAVDYSYDAFEPISLLTQTINMAGTYSDHPINSAEDIAQYVADNPGEVTFSMTPSSTDHFFWAQFFNTVGISMEDVRLVGYPGTSDQVEALLAQEIDFAMLDMPTAVSFFESGDLKSLGVAHDERLSNLPDTPTFQELGIDMVHYTNRGLFAPKGTPEGILSILEAAFETAMANEALQERIENELGSIVNFLPREEYLQYLDQSQEDLGAAARTIGFDE
ncbi:tripartite tricarboxylate transporter substrate binding protein [Halomonas sp. ML-15]|uniref:Bug family tripartite tricarboxylate transporter substrate binding protein n=1 Tax=Halomonas sp. ML-15 TaxID=2773305 RepID=UPI0017471D5F|nr:tripartite tricarboxylate transporter substrate binding protein [Halomonas sp. ML-15]MBD3894605.1 tripartite tricarboxylate transporter substrate binding protein [Halomonas sp. ML-15]